MKIPTYDGGKHVFFYDILMAISLKSFAHEKSEKMIKRELTQKVMQEQDETIGLNIIEDIKKEVYGNLEAKKLKNTK